MYACEKREQDRSWGEGLPGGRATLIVFPKEAPRF